MALQLQGKDLPALHHVSIDTDPGFDDAFTLAVLAAHASDLRITTVFGNVSADQTYKNAKTLMQHFGRNDVNNGFTVKGSEHPLQGETVSAEHIHGDNGLCGLILPDAEGGKETQSTAEQAIVNHIRSHDGLVDLIGIASMTNIAKAIALCPDLPKRVRSCSLMIGAFDQDGLGIRKNGNINDHAEFNASCDPDAARQVFQAFENAGEILHVFPLNLTHQTLLDGAFVDRVAEISPEFANMIRQNIQNYEGYGDPTIPVGTTPLHDPNTVAALLTPDNYEYETGFVQVDSSGSATSGRTSFTNAAEGNVKVYTNVKDLGIYQDLVFQGLERAIASPNHEI